MTSRRKMLSVVAVFAAVALLAGTANAVQLLTEDFQTPMYPSNTQNPSFTGWTWTDQNAVRTRTSAAQSDVPGDTSIPNQVIQLEWTNATANPSGQ